MLIIEFGRSLILMVISTTQNDYSPVPLARFQKIRITLSITAGLFDWQIRLGLDFALSMQISRPD